MQASHGRLHMMHVGMRTLCMWMLRVGYLVCRLVSDGVASGEWTGVGVVKRRKDGDA